MRFSCRSFLSLPGTLASMVAAFSFILTGCGGGMGMQGSSPVQSAALHGKVFGGQQPVTGASVQLYQVGSTSYGSAGASILTLGLPVTSDASGNFTIASDFTCPTPTTQVYFVATGGNPGLTLGTNNTALALMAAMGPCSGLTPSTFINIDEVTTVASVYALAQFMGPGTGTNGGTLLGSSSGNTAGLANAMATVNTLVNVAVGTAPGPSLPTGTIVPTSELNTLADIVATCVNTDGTGAACTDLFTDTTVGGFTPSNTIDAVLAIAMNPGSNVTNLYNLVVGTPPYQPTLGTAPNDWTIGVSYTGGASGPTGVAIDGSGNVWIANLANSSASKFSNLGVDVFDSPGLSGGLDLPHSVAIDVSGNAWFTNSDTGLGAPHPNSISKLTSAGAPSGSTPFTGGGLSDPLGIAIDGSGNVWAGNDTANVLSNFNNAGADLSGGAGFTTGGLDTPLAVAIDSANDVWAANFNGNSLSALNSAGILITGSPFTGGGLDFPNAVAIDGSGNVWVTDDDTSTPSYLLSKFDNTGTSNSGPFSGGGLNRPSGIAIDGLGRPWITNSGTPPNSISEFSALGAALSPSTGFQASGSLSVPLSLAIDGSGNIWIPNSASSTLTEVIGVAAPVVTPLATAVATNKLGQEP